MSTETENMGQVVSHEPGRSVAAPTPAHMLQTAIERGVDMEQLEKLMHLQERWEANEARKAFVKAMSTFKANPPKLVKDKTVSYTGTSYTHASLAAVVDAVVQSMGEHGLSHRWDVRQENGGVTVTCVITHELGHSERTTLTAPPDDSGKKNSIQQVASTITYLERYTLMAATGLAAADMDDDGRGAGKPRESLSDEQAAELKALLKETNSDVKAFLRAMGDFPSVDELPADRYNAALVQLNKKLKRQREGGNAERS